MAGAYDSTTAYLQSVATSALQSANNNAGRIYSLPPSTTLREPNFNVSLTKPNLGAPPTFGDLFGQDNTDPTIAYMNGQSDDWMAKYFPSINGGLKNVPEDLLIGVISGVKPFGQDKTYFELVWHQARDRAYRTLASARKNVAADFSSRGFSMAPGAMVDAVTQLEQQAASDILDVNREQALKDADIKLDMLKFAEEQAIRLKLGVMQALADFYRQWISLPDLNVRAAGVRAQAQASLYGALSTYYNVDLGFQGLQLRAAETKAGVDVDVDRNRLNRQGNYSSTAGALGSAVNAFANTAAQAAQAGGSLTAQIEAI